MTEIYQLAKKLSSANYNFFFILDFVSFEKDLSNSDFVSNLSFANGEELSTEKLLSKYDS